MFQNIWNIATLLNTFANLKIWKTNKEDWIVLRKKVWGRNCENHFSTISMYDKLHLNYKMENFEHTLHFNIKKRTEIDYTDIRHVLIQTMIYKQLKLIVYLFLLKKEVSFLPCSLNWSATGLRLCLDLCVVLKLDCDPDLRTRPCSTYSTVVQEAPATNPAMTSSTWLAESGSLA